MDQSRGSKGRDVFGNCLGVIRGKRRDRHPGNLTRHERLALRFRAASSSECLWGHWGGDHVVFHRPSGKTHLLNDPSALLITQILAAPLDVEATTVLLAAAQGAEPDPDFVKYVAGLLFQAGGIGPGRARRLVSADTLQTVGQLELGRFADRLAGPGLGVRIGPFDFLIRARVRGLELPLHLLYQDYPLLGGARVYSARVALRDVWRLLPRPERCVRFSVDGRVPHEDMPAGQRFAVLEWGLNLTIALRFHRFLLLHAAVVERNGRALLLPAAPGSRQDDTLRCAGASRLAPVVR